MKKKKSNSIKKISTKEKNKNNIFIFMFIIFILFAAVLHIIYDKNYDNHQNPLSLNT